MIDSKPKAFAARLSEAQWKVGLRTDFEYRDLGIKEATNGKVLAHTMRSNGPCKGSIGYHSHALDFQMVYLLKGWIRMEFENVGELRMEAGDAWYQPPGVKHDALEWSDDLQVLEITMPADFPTQGESRDQ